jgi:hypothetical protein
MWGSSPLCSFIQGRPTTFAERLKAMAVAWNGAAAGERRALADLEGVGVHQT